MIERLLENNITDVYGVKLIEMLFDKAIVTIGRVAEELRSVARSQPSSWENSRISEYSRRLPGRSGISSISSRIMSGSSGREPVHDGAPPFDTSSIIELGRAMGQYSESLNDYLILFFCTPHL